MKTNFYPKRVLPLLSIYLILFNSIHIVSYMYPVMMYLEKDQWSKRFDSTFFTFSMDGHCRMSEPPSLPDRLRGKTNHPAIYFELTVYCEHRSISILRRFSHFRCLLQELIDSKLPATFGPLPLMPPGTCPFQLLDEAFLQNRKEELRDFLSELLFRPECARHPAVVNFLALDELNVA